MLILSITWFTVRNVRDILFLCVCRYFGVFPYYACGHGTWIWNEVFRESIDWHIRYSIGSERERKNETCLHTQSSLDANSVRLIIFSIEDTCVPRVTYRRFIETNTPVYYDMELFFFSSFYPTLVLLIRVHIDIVRTIRYEGKKVVSLIELI